MIHGHNTKRSTHELKRLIESAVSDECHLPARGLWFCVDALESSGHPPTHLKVWATLYLLPQGSPFCCGEPDCHLGTFLPERLRRIADHIRRAMGLTQQLTIDFGDRIGVNYHKGVTFQFQIQMASAETPSNAWTELSESEHNNIWDRFYDQFKFNPSTRPENWPGITEPTPSLTWDISRGFTDADLEPDVTARILAALRHCVLPSNRIYALDWQHPSYWFAPHGLTEPDELGRWPIPIFPNGDYSIFLSPDLTFGLFGHPWEQTICIFGQKLLDAIAATRPPLLTSVVRKNGQPIA